MNATLCVLLSRRMIVAIYVQNLSIVLPVHPVKNIKKFTQEDKRQERSTMGNLAPTAREQEHSAADKNSFAAMLEAMMRAEDMEDSPSFQALA